MRAVNQPSVAAHIDANSFLHAGVDMPVRIKVRINGCATGAVLKIEPQSTSKEELIGDSLAKLGFSGPGQVNVHRAKLFLDGGYQVK